jgi:hypothetical protein
LLVEVIEEFVCCGERCWVLEVFGVLQFARVQHCVSAG